MKHAGLTFENLNRGYKESCHPPKDFEESTAFKNTHRLL